VYKLNYTLNFEGAKLKRNYIWGYANEKGLIPLECFHYVIKQQRHEEVSEDTKCNVENVMDSN
jgi:hypothetical protein